MPCATNWFGLDAKAVFTSLLCSLLLSRSKAAQLFPEFFAGSQQQQQQQAANSSSFFRFINTHLQWDPSLPAAAAAAAAPQKLSPGSTAAVVLGTLLGVLLLGMLAALLLVASRRRARRPSSSSSSSSAGKDAASSSGRWFWQRQQRHGRGGGGSSFWPSQGRDHNVDADREASDAHLALYAAAAGYAECGEGRPSGAGARDSLMRSFMSAGGRNASSSAGNGPARCVSDLGRQQQQQMAAAFAAGASVSGRGTWDLEAALHPQQLQQLADATAAEIHARQMSGTCEQGSKGNNNNTSLRALHGAIAGAAAGIGQTSFEVHTATEDGTQQGMQQQGIQQGAAAAAAAAAGDAAAVGRGHHKQQVFEDARKRLGTKAGDLARSDALVLEAVLGEGTFGKVFRGEKVQLCWCCWSRITVLLL
jgi:hypothetical protein